MAYSGKSEDSFTIVLLVLVFLATTGVVLRGSGATDPGAQEEVH